MIPTACERHMSWICNKIPFRNEFWHGSCIANVARQVQPEDWRGAFSRSRSEEHTSELQSLMRNSYAVFCLKKKKNTKKYKSKRISNENYNKNYQRMRDSIRTAVNN